MAFEGLRLPPALLPPEAEALRGEVRDFIGETRDALGWTPQSNFATSFSADFSRRLGAKGWIGMTWPEAYGGAERSYLERYVVIEELLAAGAPVGAHWIADRQSGPLLLRFATEAQKADILPRITRGECYFSIGMSEPDSGSDLASVRTRAEKVDGGWRLTGTKVWTSNAHLNHYMIALCRTAPAGEDRHAGLSQFLVDLASDGLSIRPIRNLAGAHDFNEVVLDAVFVPEEGLIGREGDGWAQVTSELAYERSGPERFLSTFRLFAEQVRAAGPAPDPRAAEAIGRLTAHLWTLRTMSVSVASLLQFGRSPDVAAAVVKEVGNRFERDVAEAARLICPVEPDLGDGAGLASFADTLADAVLQIPSFTLRGGTTEIMRSIIARELGLR